MPKRKLSEEEKKSRITPKQRKFLKAFSERCACNISATCKAIGVTRKVYYNWMSLSDAFREAVEYAQEELLDFAETKLQQNISEGKESSIFFFLKTKGKKRGYIETAEQNVTINAFEKFLEQIED